MGPSTTVQRVQVCTGMSYVMDTVPQVQSMTMTKEETMSPAKAKILTALSFKESLPTT